jgi:hypothetical protein
MKILLSLFLICLTPFAIADSRSFDRIWLGLMGKKAISHSDYFVWNEVQARLDSEEFVAQQILLRWGLLKKISEQMEIGAIYGYIMTDNLREHRPTLQFLQFLSQDPENIISLRHRVEYRKREDQTAISARFRALIRYQRKFNSGNSFILWDEPFLNITREDWTGRRAVERNRLFIGTGLPTAGVQLEVGYMNQFTPRSNRNTHEHILVLYVTY